MRRLVLTLAVTAACGGSGGGMGDDDDDVADAAGNPNDVVPMLIPGSGVGSGAINGEVNVFVVDADDRPIRGANVSLASGASGTTDATGLIVFEDLGMVTPQTITATASGFAAGTFVGANGANVTIALTRSPASVPTANVKGTIQGWDSLSPGLTNYIVAIVLYSYTNEFGARENSIAQPMNGNTPTNLCVKTAFDGAACNWEMNVRTGRQIHFAVIAEGDPQGTNSDASDDTFDLIGYAVLGGRNPSAGQTITGETLTMVGSGGLADLNVSIPSGPGGLSDPVAIPFLDMGADGQLLFPLPTLRPGLSTTKVLATTGQFAAGNYLMVGLASPTFGDAHPYSSTFQRNINIGSTVTLPAWLPSPGGLSSSGGSYSFTPSSGASVHTASFVDAAGELKWSVLLVDGASSFTLPTISPNPLAGATEFRVAAVSLPGFDPDDFTFDSFSERLGAAAEASMAFNPE